MYISVDMLESTTGGGSGIRIRCLRKIRIKGWVSLSSDAAHAVLEIGGALISTGDPTETDAKKAAARRGHPLLYVVEGRAGNQPVSMKSVMVSALDLRAVAELTPESYLQSVGQRFKRTGGPLELNGVPKITVGERNF